MRLVLPHLADGLVGCESFEGLEPASEVLGGDEVAEMLPELIVAVVVVALDDGFLDGAVHALHLTLGPRMLHLGQPVLDTVFVADTIEDVVEGVFVAGAIGELDAAVREHGVDGVGHGRDQVS